MKFTHTILAIFSVFCLLSIINAQGKSTVNNKEFPYVEVIGCIDCNDLAISLPTPVLQKPLDVFPSKNLGKVMVQIFVDINGNVEKANAISGHPFFRPIIEKAALTAKFRPKMVQGLTEKFKAIIVYRIVSEGDEDLTIKTRTKIGVVNGMATFLPRPIYSNEAKEGCADGKVEVEVLIDTNGRVVSAKAISGDELLQDAAVAAAMKARFRQIADAPPIKTKGIVVYNFVSERKCLSVGIVNKRALHIPKPILHRRFKPKTTVEVQVKIVINMEGKVTYARTISVVAPWIKTAIETSAGSAKFSPTLIDSPPILVRGILLYKFKPDGSIAY